MFAAAFFGISLEASKSLSGSNSSSAALLALACASMNTAVDVITQWRFYFPSGSIVPLPPYKVFVAAPFTGMSHPVQQSSTILAFDAAYRGFLEGILRMLDGIPELKVISSHRKEAWGAKLRQPDKAVARRSVDIGLKPRD